MTIHCVVLTFLHFVLVLIIFHKFTFIATILLFGYYSTECRMDKRRQRQKRCFILLMLVVIIFYFSVTILLNVGWINQGQRYGSSFILLMLVVI